MVTHKKQIRFALAEPKKGIIAFDVTVEAEDKESAVDKFVNYLIELRRTFTRQAAPLKKTNDAAIIARTLFFRLNQTTDPTSFVLTTHLFCEYWLNLILERFCHHCDLSKHSFRTKLEIVFGIGKIPKRLFENLEKFNKLRNDASHRLDFDFTKMDLGYHPSRPEFRAFEYKPSFAPDANQHHVFNVLGVVMADTYMQLHSHCVEHLGFKKIKAALNS